MIDFLREVFCPVHGVFAPANWQMVAAGFAGCACHVRGVRAGYARVVRGVRARWFR